MIDLSQTGGPAPLIYFSNHSTNSK